MKTIFRNIVIILTFFVMWTAIVKIFDIPNYLLPTPTEVFIIFYNQWQLILHETWPTIIEIILGFVFGITFGVTTACLLVFFKRLNFWVLPLIIVSQAIPTFAIAPLIVVWLGYGLASKIAITTLMIYFPITSAFYDGLRHTPIEWLQLAKTMQAQKWRTFIFIRVPAALPSLAEGIRIAAVTAPIGAIIGEWVGAGRGLGFLMLNANARMQIDMMFAALIVIISIAIVLYFSIDKLLHLLVGWQKTSGV